jgi:hypothetical protein
MMDDFRTNRRQALAWLAASGAATALLAGGAADAADTKTPLKDVPDKIKDAASRAAPKAQWIEAFKVEEEGKLAFELDGTDPKNREITVLVTADGKAIEVETELRNKKVPDNVLAAVRDRWPKFELDEAYEIRHGENLQGRDDGAISYDLKGNIVKDRYLRVEVSAAGKFIESVLELPSEKVPRELIEAIHKKWQRFKVDVVYVIREERVLTGYEVVGKRPKDDESRTVLVSADFSTVEFIE